LLFPFISIITPYMEWEISNQLVGYADALSAMDARVRAVQTGDADELCWLLEHPPVYTAGSSAKAHDLLQQKASSKAPLPVFETGRGGQYTYHGPGQRVGYALLDLKARAHKAGGKPDIRAYVKCLERWMIDTLNAFGVEGFIRQGRVGVWVNTPMGEAKIAALGVRVQKWVTSHGIALNVAPDLSHYQGIVPCGLAGFGVTSLQALGVDVSMDGVDAQLQKSFHRIFDFVK
jgi:lipoyl(octanoyl) transferase